jgi:hypothetical protein
MRYPGTAFICVSFITILLTNAGCASGRRYEVVAPGTARGAVLPNAGTIVTRDKIDYEVFQAEDKVIVRFVNRTGQPIKLTEQSASFDAAGRSFAVGPEELAPDQSGRIVLPATLAVEHTRTPTVATEVRIGGVDEGGIIGTRRDVENNDAEGGSIGSTAAPPPGFRWPPNALARVRFVYHVGESVEDVTHEWAIRRTK